MTKKQKRAVQHGVVAFAAAFCSALAATSGPLDRKVIVGLVATAAVTVFRKASPA